MPMNSVKSFFIFAASGKVVLSTEFVASRDGAERRLEPEMVFSFVSSAGAFQNYIAKASGAANGSKTQTHAEHTFDCEFGQSLLVVQKVDAGYVLVAEAARGEGRQVMYSRLRNTYSLLRALFGEPKGWSETRGGRKFNPDGIEDIIKTSMASSHPHALLAGVSHASLPSVIESQLRGIFYKNFSQGTGFSLQIGLCCFPM